MKSVLIFLLIIVHACIAHAYDFKVGDIYYLYDSYNQSAIVTSYDGGNTNRYRGNIVIPDTISYNGRKLPVLTIDDKAFMNCSELYTVKLPSILRKIGDYAFYHCYELSSINFPSSLVKISSFQDCRKLKSLDINCPNCTTITGFNNCDGLEFVEINCPSCTSIIGFNYCDGLEYVKINTKDINDAFKYCDGLKTIVISGNVDHLYGASFEGCKNVETFVIEDSETKLNPSNGIIYGDPDQKLSPKRIYIGRDCSYSLLKNSQDSCMLSIGTNVEHLELFHYATYVVAPFYKKIYIMNENPIHVGGFFGNSTYLNCILYVPIGTKQQYQSANPWKNFFNIVEMAVEDMWHGEVEIPDDPGPGPDPDPNYLKCDVNGDGEVNIADINTIVEAILSH